MIPAVCKVIGCRRKHKGLGYCNKHYAKFKFYGDPLGYAMKRIEPVVCDCPTSTPEHIRLFDAWQCAVCYRKCDAPVAAVAS